MDKEMLEALSKLLDEKLDQKLEPIKNMIEKQTDLIKELEAKNATRHTEINIKLEELKELKQVTKENCYDIAKLKAVK